MSASEDTSFARLVSLACHDIRTPLATVIGFARTLPRTEELGERGARYVEMIDVAATQISELVDELGLAARIDSGRLEPTPTESDSLELAHGAAELLQDGQVAVEGDGAMISVETVPARQAVAALARCLLRHGVLEQVSLRVDGSRLVLEPVAVQVGPIVLGEDLKDFGAAVAVRYLEAVGSFVRVDGEALAVELPVGNASAHGSP